ncbi:MAG TPA: hypothetical protein VHV83_10140, partial [Armatimonadota bacterium]|nr:hypothetical protein [Armatimonadota bacterium]
VFGRQGTFVWLPEFLQQLTALGVSETISFDEYAQAVGERGAHFAAHYGGQLVAAGRSPYRLSAYLATKSLEECFNESCAHELLHCGFGHYDLYGNIIPCSCSGISLGNAADLGEFTRTFSLDDHPVLHALVTHGVKGLYAMAVAEYGYNPLERYAGKCHLCGDIRKHLVASGAQLSELAPRDYYAQV